MFFARYTLSPHLIIIPPMLHIHFLLHVTLTRMANGRNLGTFKKQCCFGIRSAFKGANNNEIKIVGHWGYSWLHSSSDYSVEVNGQIQSPASLSLRKHPPRSLYILGTGRATDPIPIRRKSEKFLCASSMTPLSCDYIEQAVADS